MQNSYIPNIDISSLLSSDFNDDSYKNVAKEIKKASEEIGFFTVTGHGISNTKIDKLLSTCRHFFHSPDKEKLKIAPKKWNPNTDTVYRGYFPSSVNGKEGLDIGDLKVTKKYSANLNNQYIEFLNLGLCFNKNSINILNKYFDNIYRLSETLFKSVIKLNKKNPDISSAAFSRLKTLSTLRFNYYPNQTKPIEISKQDGVALGCETHVDSGIFTVLYQDRKGGLQVQNRKNKKWYDVPFNKKALVVNTGRALEFLSKGKFKATNHRVLWNKSKRLSVPFFFEPSYDFKMNQSFLNGSKFKNNGPIYEKFLNKSLKKFIEYQR